MRRGQHLYAAAAMWSPLLLRSSPHVRLLFPPQVMIYELADHVQGFLSEHNKPPSRSFHEEMLKNQRRKQEKRAQEEQQRMDQQRKRAEETVRRQCC